MNYAFILFGIVFIPIAGSLLLPVAGRISSRLRNLLALFFVLCSFAFSLTLIPLILSGGTLTFSKELALGFNFVLVADGLAVFMACVSSFISAIIVLYSFDYISHYENQNEYYFMMVLFLGSMMGLVLSGNLIFLYFFWEMTALASWRLIGFFREKTHVLKADKAFLVTIFGALAMLIGFITIYSQTGSFDLAIIKESLKTIPVTNLAVLLILAGIFSKSATLPFHTWLPDAGVAPSPVTAMLHAAILVKIGTYVFARLFLATFTLDALWHTVIPIIAAASALVAAGAALIEKDLKRIIAYSTISQIGFIFFGLAVGNQAAIAGGLLYILMHGLAKAGLFLCAGIIEQNTGIRDITKMGGLFRTMPVTAVAFLGCAFSVMGIPPFGGFFSKYLVFSGAISNGRIAISLVFLVGAFMTILYLLRLFNLVFMGEPQTSQAKEKSRMMVACVMLLAILSLAGGILVNYPVRFIQTAIQGMVGMVN
ncbi:MAG: NADH-quinone oxidoreductase subunit L [Candidatus Omnitrophica bacterium]|nr:NADH-quinone oxidoreductase subunit L [Candidatus Omnitrophota bacterium]